MFASNYISITMQIHTLKFNSFSSANTDTQSLNRCDAHLFVDFGNLLKFCSLVLVLRLWVGAQALEKFQTTDRWDENISFLFSSSEED